MSSTMGKWVAISCQIRILSPANSSALGPSFPSPEAHGPQGVQGLSCRKRDDIQSDRSSQTSLI